MTVFFETLFIVLPYIGILGISWVAANKFDIITDQFYLLNRRINEQDKKIAGLTKKCSSKKK
jgi:hypothetical protein